MLAPIVVGVAAWVWTGLRTSEAACMAEHPIRWPGWAGAAMLAGIGAAAVVWRARWARLSVTETIGLAAASIIASAFWIALALGIWIIGHHCAD